MVNLVALDPFWCMCLRLADAWTQTRMYRRVWLSNLSGALLSKAGREEEELE